MSKRNKTGVLCQNFSVCNSIIDVTDEMPITMKTYRTQPISEKRLCKECSEKKFQEQAKKHSFIRR